MDTLRNIRDGLLFLLIVILSASCSVPRPRAMVDGVEIRQCAIPVFYVIDDPWGNLRPYVPAVLEAMRWWDAEEGRRTFQPVSPDAEDLLTRQNFAVLRIQGQWGLGVPGRAIVASHPVTGCALSSSLLIDLEFALATGSMGVETVARHELGHVLGYAHGEGIMAKQGYEFRSY